MSWSDEPENEERWHEWEGMLDDASSSIQSLADDFEENESHNVLAWADRLVAEVVAIHEAAGVLHLPTDPVIDVAGDADLVSRWKEAELFLDDDEADHDRPAREACVAFAAVSAAARRFCDIAETALSQVARELDETGCPSPSSLATLADGTLKLVEWTHIYGASALGMYRVTGCMPDTRFGGGPLEQGLAYERAEEMSGRLVGAQPWH